MFHVFGSVKDFFTILGERYLSKETDTKKSEKREKKKQIIRLRVITFIKLWIQKQFYDFFDDEISSNFQKFLKIVENENSQHFQEIHTFYQKTIQSEKEIQSQISQPLIPPTFKAQPLSFDIYTITPQQLALQFTLLHFHILLKINGKKIFFFFTYFFFIYNIFSFMYFFYTFFFTFSFQKKINYNLAKEFIKQAWLKKEAKEKAPNLLHFVHFFNNVKKKKNFKKKNFFTLFFFYCIKDV